MSVAFNAVTVNKYGNIGGIGFDHTVGAGINRLLIAGLSIEKIASSPTVCSFGGVPLSRLSFVVGSDRRAEFWYLVNPPSGVSGFSLTMSPVTNIVVAVSSWSGVDQVTPLTGAATATATSAAPSVSVVSTSRNLVVDVLSAKETDGTLTATPGSGQAQRWNDKTTYNPNWFNPLGAGSTEPGAASVSMDWTLSGSAVWCLIGASINAAKARMTAHGTIGASALAGAGRVNTTQGRMIAELASRIR